MIPRGESKEIRGMVKRVVRVNGSGYKRDLVGRALRHNINPSIERQVEIIEDYYASEFDRRAKAVRNDDGIPVIVPDGKGERFHIDELVRAPEGRDVILAHAQMRKRAGGTNYKVGLQYERYVAEFLAAEQGA